MKPKFRTIRLLAGSIALFASISTLHAATYYWDNNNNNSGFGSASGTWAAPTTNSTTLGGWTTTAAGNTALSGTTTTTTSDLINFGNGATGLGLGMITVSGTVDSGDITFASGSGVITLNGGTITLADASTINVNNSVDVITSNIGGASTSFTKAGTGTLFLSGANTYTGSTNINAGTLVARSASAVGTGLGANVSIATNTGLIHNAAADTQLAIGGNLSITGGTSTVIGTSIGTTATSGAINIAGNATTDAAAVRLDIYGVSGVTHGSGTMTLIDAVGGGSTLNNATYTLGAVYNNTDFTVGALSATTNQLTVATSAATALTAAYWKGGLGLGNNVWAISNGSTQSNWVSSLDGADQALVPGAGTDVFIANSTVTTAPTATVLGSDMSIKSLSISHSGSAFAVNGNGYALTIGTGGISKLSGSGSNTSTISANVNLSAAQTWTNNSTSTLTVTANGNLINNNGHQLTLDGTGTINLGVVSSTVPLLTGSGALVKNGTGRANIGGVNSGFTGTVTLNGGVTQVTPDGNALAVGNLTLNGGVLTFYWSSTYSRTLGTGNNQVQILGGVSGFGGSGTSGPTVNLGSSVRWGTTGEGAVDPDPGATGFFNPSKFVLGDAGTGNAGVITFSSAIDLNGATRTIVVPKGTSAGGNRSTISGAISNSTATASLVKEGGGKLDLTNNTSAWNGSTTVSGGILDMGGINLANIGGGSGRNISVAGGAVVRFNALSNAVLNRIVETTDEIGVMTGTTANNFDFSSSSGATLPNAFLGNWASNGAKAEISGIITPGSNGYKFGSLGSSGLLGIRDTLTGANSLTIGQTGSSGIRVNIVAANTHTGDTVINTGSRLTLGNNLALQNSALNVGAAGGNFSCAAGTNAGKITGETAASSPTFGGLKGSRNLISVFSNSAGNNETNLAASAVTGFTLNVGTGNTHTYSGAIGGFGTGAVSNAGGNSILTKTGEGTQILTGTHTYTGATTITGGTLDLGTTGSIAASTSLVLGAAGTLDVSDQASYAIPAAQPVEFGIDATGSGSAGKIVAAGLDVSNATVTYNIAGPLDDAAYVLATYTAPLAGTGTFLSVPAAPSGYELDYDYQGNKIALVSTGAPTGFAAWQAANGTAGGRDQDHDNDGVDNGTEHFLGGTANTTGFTALPTVVDTAGTLSVTWTKAASYTGTYGTDYVVETSATLAGPWTVESSPGNVTITGNDVKYTFPAPLGTKNFARLKVTGP